MNNRKRITQFCKQHKITLLSCICDRFTEQSFGESSQCWDWIIKVNIDNFTFEYASYKGYNTTEEDVIEMLIDIQEDIISIREKGIEPTDYAGCITIPKD